MKSDAYEIGNIDSNEKKLLNKPKLIERLIAHPIKGFLFNFFNSYSDVELTLEYLKQHKYNIPKFLLLNKNCVHNILYKFEEQIKFDSFEIKNELNNYFCLSLLIMDKPEIVNYSYSLNFVNDIHKFNLKQEKKLTKILISKAINDMINNLEDREDDEELCDNNLLNNIKNKNEEEIKNNLEIFNELNININFDEFLEVKIDYIYSLLINSLIKLNKFKDKKYIYDIIDQLDIENISITETIFDKLNEILNSNESYLKEYIIGKEEDLFDEVKINFYYILLQYILKNSIYIYQIPFLLKIRKIIIKVLKTKTKLIKNNLDEENKIKLNIVLKKFVDSEYYFDRKDEFNPIKLKLEEVKNYYKQVFPKYKIKDIEIIDDIINNKKGDYEKYLSEYDTAKKRNDRIPIIKYVFSLNEDKLKENELNDSINKWESFEKMVLDKKIKNMKKKEKTNLIKYFQNPCNKEKLIEIYGEDVYEYIIKCGNEIENKKNKINNNLEEDNHKNEINEKIKKNEIKNKIEEKIENKIVEIKNEFNDQFIDNSPPVPGINKEKINSYEQFLKESENNSTIQMSEKITAKNSNYSTEVKPEELIGNSAPIFPIEIKNEIIYIMNKILNKSLILLKFDRKLGDNLIFEEVYFGELNTKININKFKESLLISFNSNIMQRQNNTINNYKNFSLFLKEIEKRIKKEFIRDYPLKIKLLLENKNNNSDPNISCIYTFFEPFTNNQYSFIEDNILVNGTNSNLQGFQFMIFQMNNECYENLKEKYNNRNIKKIKGNEYNILNGENNKKESLIINNVEINKFFNTKADEDKILEFIKTIEKDNNFIGLIKELNNGNYVSFKNNHTIILYDTEFNRIKEQRFDSITNITEITNYEDVKNKDISKIIISGYKEIILMIIDFKTSNIETKNINISNIYSINFFEIKKNSYIISGSNICMHVLDLFNNNNNSVKKNIIESKSYFGGIKINENTIALTSNSLKEGGEDKIIFYNEKSKRILNEIEGYSHSISPNGLAIIQTEKIIMKNENPQKSKKNRKKKNKNKNTNEANEKSDNEKILLCACKRYRKKEENGILLINPQIQENKNVEHFFYNTGNFEPYCFCQILIVENNNKNLDNIDDEYKKNIKIKETYYFLVGGLDEEKRRGVIKLYKVNFNEKSYNKKLEYLQDIELDEFFEGPINCIIQSRTSGNILATCYNGNIYLFSMPNINFYLNEEEIEKDNNKLL